MALFLDALSKPGPLVTVELRPPRSDLAAEDGISAWIDLHHSLKRLTSDDFFVFLTDNAVGAAEEENLAHVVANVGEEVDVRRIVPILTCKHSLSYCETFAIRAASDGFEALTVLGGDVSVPPPRCVPHGRDLRQILSQRLPEVIMGGWVNPHRSAREQVDFISAPDAHAEFALSQVVSHHSVRDVESFMEETAARPVEKPVVYGVFFYRSATPKTLSILSNFFPVPIGPLTKEFEAGRTAEEICAQTIRELRSVGADKIYVSNLGERGVGRRLRRILEQV